MENIERGNTMNDEKTIEYISYYFVLKAVLGFIGIVMFSTQSFYALRGGALDYITFLFGDTGIMRSMMFLALLLVVLNALTAYGLHRRFEWAKIFAVVLCAVDLYSFPVGTIASLIIIGLLFTAKDVSFKRIDKTNKVIGLCLFAFAIGGLLFSSGFASQLLEDESDIQAQSMPELKILSTNLTQQDEEVEVVILLDSLDGKSGAQAQSVFVQDVQTLGGEVVDTTFYSANTVTTKIQSDKLVSLASNPKVKYIVENEEMWFAPASVQYDNTVQFLDDSSELLEVEDLWEQGITGEDIVVAVVDTGINSNIAPFQRNGKSIVIDSLELYGEYVFWHGTAVASCIASQDDERKGIAPNVDLLNVEVFMPGGSARLSDILKGWDWVANWKQSHDRQVVCCNSLGAIPSRATAVLDVAANRMVTEQNIPMIVASGNYHPNVAMCSPGTASEVLTVGAVNDYMDIAPFSCRGGKNKPDVVAPGVNIKMFDEHGNEKTASGTSFATPLTAGAVALAMQKYPGYSADQITESFKTGAIDLAAQGYDETYGYGLVNTEHSIDILGSQKPDEVYTSVGNENTVPIGILPLLVIVGLLVIFYPEIKKRM